MSRSVPGTGSEGDLADGFAGAVRPTCDVGLGRAGSERVEDGGVQFVAGVVGASLRFVRDACESFEVIHGTILADLPRGLTSSQGGWHTWDMTTTENETDAQAMYRYGQEAARDDRRTGTYSAPVESEDGPDYTRGYLEAWSA